MISQKTQLSVQVNDKDYSFQCEPSASLTDVFSALDQLRSYVYGRIKEAEEAQKASQESAKTEG